jgi:hypothetical protein
MFLMFKRWRYRRIGPLGIAFGAYRAWRRLSPTQKEQIKRYARTLHSRLRPRPSEAPEPS